MIISEWLNTELGQQIWEKKYRHDNESLDDWFKRVSGGNQKVEKLIREKKFLFGGRTLTNRGLKEGSYSNCYSSGYVEDNIDDIMQVNTNLALTYKAQGGQGLSLSKIRPKGTLIGNRYESDGIIPFMELFNQTTNSLKQGGCIAANSKVLTKRGYINIQDVIIGDFVWTKVGWVLVNFVFDKGEQDVYEVITEKGYKIKTTKDHKFCIDGFNSLKLEDLPVGSYANIIVGQTHGVNITLPNGNILTEDIAYFIGYLNGNGNFNANKNGGTLTLNYKDGEIKNKLINIIKSLGFETEEFDVHVDSFTRLSLRCDFISWLISNGIEKNKANNIKIPEFIFLSKPEIISSYLAGAIDSDGTVYDSSFKYNTVSKLYASQIADLMKILGYLPSIHTCIREGRLPLYEIRDSFRENQRFPTKSIKFKNNFVKTVKNSRYSTPYSLNILKIKASESGVEHLKKISKNKLIGLYSYLSIKTKKYEPIIFDKIKSITFCGKEHVYDLSLESEHFFMCEGFYISNSRKGALMVSLDITHKEAENFITIKSDLNKINQANLSLEIDDEFMNLVEESYKTGESLTLSVSRTYGSNNVEYEIVPIKLYKLLIKQAWKTAEPGVLFTNRLRNYNLMEFVDEYQIETVNPCGEQPLPKNGACNLGSINLSEYVEQPFTKSARFNYTAFSEDVRIAVAALDTIIDENLGNHALKEQKEMSYNYRNIGLGYMGLADAMIKMGITYGSEESVAFVRLTTKEMLRQAVFASSQLAVSRGTFPKYDQRIFDSSILKRAFSTEELSYLKGVGIRNCSLLSIAPTGSLGTMLNISTGIEPNFAISYKRKTEALHGSESKYYEIFTGIAAEYIDKFNTELPKYFVTSHNINWKDRINVQSAAQEFIDTAISATINLPKEISVDEIESLYLYAWKKGLKGVTIYREGSRDGILTTEKFITYNEDFFIRPEILEAKVIHFINDSTPWIAFVGIKDNKPFEIFSGPANIEVFPIPKFVSSGEIIKVKNNGEETRYDFRYTDLYGYKNTLGGLSRIFNKEYWNYARLISGLLRHQVNTVSVIEIIEGMSLDSESLHSWKNGVIRALKTFIENGTKTTEVCPECNSEITYQEGCKQCISCGWSKC